MTHEFLRLPAFACIGLEMEDSVSDCQEWIPKLWARCRSRFAELGHLERGGNWGLMSDPDVFLAPWGSGRGRYLASCQVPLGTAPFADWRVWEIPEMAWLRIPCRVDQIFDALEHARRHLGKDLDWCWEGSVHEHYPDGFRNPATDALHLMVGLSPR